MRLGAAARRALKVAAIAFATLVLKEWLETREWDFAACAIDGAWIGGGFFVVDGILNELRGSKARA